MFLFCYRYFELAAWLSSKESQLRLLRNRANDPSRLSEVKSTIEVGQKNQDVRMWVYTILHQNSFVSFFHSLTESKE